MAGASIAGPLGVVTYAHPFTRAKVKTLASKTATKIATKVRPLLRPSVVRVGGRSGATGTAGASAGSEVGRNNESLSTNKQPLPAHFFPKPTDFFKDSEIKVDSGDPVINESYKDLLWDFYPPVVGGILPAVLFETSFPVIGAAGQYAQARGMQKAGRLLSRTANSRIARSPITKWNLIGLGIAAGGAGASYLQKKHDAKKLVDHLAILNREKVRLERQLRDCLLYTSPSPRDRQKSRMPSSA